MSFRQVSSLEQFAERLHRLSPLSGEDRDCLMGMGGDIIQARANIDIVLPGTVTDYCHLIVEGVIGRFAQFSDGKRQITAIHIVGDMADLRAVATPALSPAMQALTTSTLLRFTTHELRAIARSRPALAQAFWAYSAVDAAVVERWAANLGRRTASQRMAHFLCEFGLRMENAGRGDRLNFTLDLTQTQLGEALGLTPVHVNRTLKAFRTQHLVTTTKRDFLVHDWERLAALGDFDRTYLTIDEMVREAA